MSDRLPIRGPRRAGGRRARLALVAALAPALVGVWAAASAAQPTAATSASGGGGSGHLLIIGGGERPPELARRLVQLAGGRGARIAIVPNASSVPDEAAAEQAAELLAAGAGAAFPLRFSRETADAPETLAALEGATGVFFSGGDQSRLTAALLGTRLLEAMRALHARGGVLAGTSAGAAVMSRLMITGDERHQSDPERAFSSVLAGNVVTAEGFGFLEGAIVDQHFLARRRHNRLLSLVLEHPDLLGIGVDEETAILVGPDRRFEVLGRRQVLVLDARAARGIGAGAGATLHASDVRLHLLGPGQRFDLDARRPLPPANADAS